MYIVACHFVSHRPYGLKHIKMGLPVLSGSWHGSPILIPSPRVSFCLCAPFLPDGAPPPLPRHVGKKPPLPVWVGSPPHFFNGRRDKQKEEGRVFTLPSSFCTPHTAVLLLGVWLLFPLGPYGLGKPHLGLGEGRWPRRLSSLPRPLRRSLLLLGGLRGCSGFRGVLFRS